MTFSDQLINLERMSHSTTELNGQQGHFRRLKSCSVDSAGHLKKGLSTSWAATGRMGNRDLSEVERNVESSDRLEWRDAYLC